MFGKLHIQQNWAALLAFVFGAAVIVPSIVALVLSIVAIAESLL